MNGLTNLTGNLLKTGLGVLKDNIIDPNNKEK
jgi:hypothetical protein